MKTLKSCGRIAQAAGASRNDLLLRHATFTPLYLITDVWVPCTDYGQASGSMPDTIISAQVLDLDSDDLAKIIEALNRRQ